MKKTIILIITILTFSSTQAQNDSIYFWKAGVMIHKQSIKPADLDTISFRRNSTALNIPGPIVNDSSGTNHQSVINCYQAVTTTNLNSPNYSDGTSIP